MRFRFDDGDLGKICTEAKNSHKHGASVVRALRKLVQVIQAAPDERTLRGMRSLHLEKLKGPKAHQHSMKLDDQWRLVIEIEGKGPEKVVAIVSIEDYH